MTLCITWRAQGAIHLASDSRVTIGTKAADVAIKVLAAPYRIFSAFDVNGNRSLITSGDIGLCVAGHATGALSLKESITDVLADIQAMPGYSQVSMDGISDLVFQAYTVISKPLIAVLGAKGIATVIVAGHCHGQGKLRAFKLATNASTAAPSRTEVLLNDGDHELLGSGRTAALAALPASPTNIQYIETLKAVIDNPKVPGVGGNIQYGTFKGKHFQTYGCAELGSNVHYWRGALDLNDPVFTASNGLVLCYPLIDPFKHF